MPTTSETQGTRRVKYGLNVAIAIAAAAAVVVILNIISYKYLERVRVDTTHTRLYSLSDQTRKLLRALKNEYRIVTLIVNSSPYLENAKDLIGEYGHYSSNVQVDHINPTASRAHSFFNSLLDRFQTELQQIRGAIENGRKSLKTASRMTGDLRRSLEETLDATVLASAEQKQLLIQVSNFFQRFQHEAMKIEESIDVNLESALPDFDAVLASLRSPLEQLNEALTVSTNQFNEWADDESTPNALKERLLRLTTRFEPLHQQLDKAVEDLRSPADAGAYTSIRRQLASESDTVAVLAKDEVRIIAVSEMFRQSDPQAAANSRDAVVDLAFIGEERITGALVSMELEQKPLVVFVSGGQQPALGNGGAFQHVADRLTTMNLEVKEWSQGGRRSPYGGPPMPPGPPPEPEPGQHVVWVVPPLPGANPMQPQPGPPGGQQVADHIKQQLEKGHAAMVMFTPQGMSFGPANPLLAAIDGWGITPKLDRRLLKRVILADRQEAADNRMIITSSWPVASAITETLSGIRGVFWEACPLELDTSISHVKHMVLAEATGRGLWAETNLFDRNPRYKPEAAGDAFTVAVAAEMDGARLVVVGDGLWATDIVTTNAEEFLRLRGMANVFGAAYPANAELFVNSVYWLSGLEQLIARSARTQDIRRVDITPQGLSFTRWVLLLGMPMLTAASGVGVWMVRRQG